MKTIEEAAQEYGEKVSPHSTWTAKNAETSFKAGIEFAQRWIPIEEELPEPNIDVFAKCGNTYWIARLQPHGKGLTLYSIKSSRYSEEFEATLWRPIERK